MRYWVRMLLELAYVVTIALVVIALLNAVFAQDQAISSNPDPAIPYEQENPGLPVVPPVHVEITTSGLDYSEGSPGDYGDAWFEAYFTPKKWELDKLLFKLGDALRTEREVAWFLGMHGYNVTEEGQITLADGSQWQIVLKPGWPDLVRVGVEAGRQ